MESGTVNFEDEQTLDDFIAGLKIMQERRYSGINFWNINNGTNTIEFRIANGTLNPDLWIDNVNLFGGILAVSQEIAKSKDKRKLEKLVRLQEDIDEREKVEILLELIGIDKINEKERWNRYLNRYEVNRKVIENSFQMSDLLSSIRNGIKLTKNDLKISIQNTSAQSQEKVMDKIFVKLIKDKEIEIKDR